MKTLSVVIPFYNSAKWLSKCLDSVLNQDVPLDELEIICINDGSLDNSAEIALQYRQKYPDSIVVLSQENQGPSGARNNGMKHASGKYLCFVDPDDYVEPKVFGGLLEKMETDSLDILRFNYRIVDENDCLIEKRKFELLFDYSPCMMTGAEFLANRLDIACNIWRYMYRTELIVSNGIWCFTGDYFDDTPWLPLVLMKANRLGICDALVYNYQERNDSLVKAKTLSAVRKKIEGGYLLTHLLGEEMGVLAGNGEGQSNMRVLCGISLPDTILKKILQWYEMMIAHCVVSLLTNVAVYEYDSYKLHLEKLLALNVFPLSKKRASVRNRLKIALVNTSPALMIRIWHYKNEVLL